MRGIEWLFKFDEWLAVWMASGKWEQRGRGSSKYVMARNGDVGPYAAHNVRIITSRENIQESHVNKARDPVALSERCLGKGCGWTFVANAYQAQCRGKYLGRFKTQAGAERAYAAAVEGARNGR